MTRTRTLDLVFLFAVVLPGAALRLRGIGQPSFWLDEILHYDIATQAANQPLWRWFGIFQIENGPLFYASELAGRAIHSAEISARIAPALFGIAGIIAAWFAARSIGTHPMARYVVAILTATSPIEVYYSREARPYALVLLLTTALLIALLRKRFLLVSVLLLIALYSTAVMEPVAITIAISAALAATAGDRRFWISVAGIATACAMVIALAYHPVQNIAADQFPRLSSAFFRALLESFSVVALDTSRLHRSALTFLALAIVGAADLARRRRSEALILSIMTVFPLVIGIIGIRVMHHFFSVRYVISALPAYLLLVAVGVTAIVQWIPQRGLATATAIAIAMLLAAQGWGAAIDEPYRKLNWRTIARTIASHAHENDAVIAANGWTRICLEFYLRGLSPHLRLFDANESPMMGSVFAYQNTTSWIVSATAGAPFNDWACRFPVVLASPLEDFRLQYVPTTYYFLTDRSSDAEHRALRASFANREPALHFGPGEDAFFDQAWGGAEPEAGGYARWVIGRTAHIALPLGAASDRTLTIDLLPLAQRLSMFVNDHPIGSIALPGTRSRFNIESPAAVWREGLNVLTFEFDRALAPADIDPRSSDHRALAARFYLLTFAGSQPAPSCAHLVRLRENGPFLEGSKHDRRLPEPVDARRLTQFAGRLGFDPQHVLGDLLDGRVTLADLAASSLADDSVCFDDQRFLENVFRALLNREISLRELRSFEDRLRHGISRAKIVRDLANSDEVRREIAR